MQRRPLKRMFLALAAVAVMAAPAADVGAWGATGHRLIGVAAMRALPDEIPAFLRTTQAATEVATAMPTCWNRGNSASDSVMFTATEMAAKTVGVIVSSRAK